MDLDSLWKGPVPMVTVVSHLTGSVGPGSAGDCGEAVVPLGLRTSGADLLQVTLSEPRYAQPARGHFPRGVERNTEDSRGSSTICQHCLVLKGNGDQ